MNNRTFSRPALAALTNPVGTRLCDIDTPALLLDLDAAGRNLAVMKRFAERYNCALRPHAKMHKCPEISKWQMREGGAVGICVQKVSEAEAQVAGGVHDVFVSNEVVDRRKLSRFAALASGVVAAKESEGWLTPARLTICCDCVAGVERLAEALHKHFHSISSTTTTREEGLSATTTMADVGVFLEIDVGQQRCGAAPATERCIAVAKAVLEAAARNEAELGRPLLYFAGIHAYHGAAQHIRRYADRADTIRKVVEAAVDTKALLVKNGVPVPLITGAGTGTFSLEARSGVYGELQPGSYLVSDRDYEDNEQVDPEEHPVFERALFVATRVHSEGVEPGAVAVVDAGHKAHAIDTGLPVVHKRPDLCFLNGGDEHGVLRYAETEVERKSMPTLDALLFLVPGHCDPTCNLHDTMLGIRGGRFTDGQEEPSEGVVETVFSIDGRGCCS